MIEHLIYNILGSVDSPVRRNGAKTEKGEGGKEMKRGTRKQKPVSAAATMVKIDLHPQQKCMMGNTNFMLIRLLEDERYWSYREPCAINSVYLRSKTC